jgi:taurine dioxygenase
MGLSVTPLSDALGVEVMGVDLSRPIASADLALMQRALADHLVMVVRDQRLDPAEYLAAARLFGETMAQHLSEMLMSEHPEIAVLDSATLGPGPDGRVVPLGSRDWHTDHTNHARPPKITALYAVELPPEGGDTSFANMQAAYRALPEAERERLAAMRTVNKIEDFNYVSAADKDRFGERQIHPLVRTHPDSGKKALYFHPGKTERIEGMEPAESLAFLDELLDRVIRPEVTYRHEWRPGDLLLWDNRAVLHIAHHDYDMGAGRVMHRVILEGEVPY